jgi:ankyrin repeat protein
MSGLLVAAQVGDLAKMQRLVGEGASVHEVNKRGTNALMFAFVNAHTPIVRWLLKTGGARISCANNGMTALSIAAINGQHFLCTKAA